MPIDFKLNFVEPLMLDIEKGNIPDMDTFSGKIAEYYEKTILQGIPNAIPSVMISPTLTSAALGVPTTAPVGSAADGYVKPGSYNSTLRMYRNVAKYYVNRELIMGEQDLKTSIETVKSLYQEQSFNVKRAKVLALKIKEIKDQLKTLPEKIKDITEVAKVLLGDYKKVLTSIKEEFDSAEFAQQVATAGVGQVSVVFKEEFEIINTIQNIKLSDVPNIIQAIQILNDYDTKISSFQNKSKAQQKQLVTNRIKIIISRIKEALGAIIEPTSFGPLLSRLTSDKAEVQAKIDKAKKSFKELQQVEEQLRPTLLELERRIKEEKENAKIIIKKRIQDEKDKISRKQEENAKKKAQKAALAPSKIPKDSPKKEAFKQAIVDIKTLKANDEENIKLVKKKTKALGTIIKNGTALILEAYAIKTAIIEEEIPLLKEQFAELTGSVVGLLGTNQFLGFDQNTQGALNRAGTSASASFVQLQANASASLARVQGVDSIQDLRQLNITKKIGSNFTQEQSQTEVNLVKQYINKKGLTDIANPLVALFKTSKVSFQTFRKYITEANQKYDKYVETISSWEPKLKTIVNSIRELDDEKTFLEPVDLTSAKRNERYEKSQEKAQKKANRAAMTDVEKALQALPIDVPPKHSIVSFFKLLFRFIQRAKLWVSKAVKKVKDYLEKQKEKAIKIANELKVQALAKIPIPNYVTDATTQEEVAKEKMELIKQFKAKVQKSRAQAEAIALVGQAAIPLVTNIGAGKLKSSDNDKWLRQIGLGRFKYETIGLDPQSPDYKRFFAQKTQWDTNINSLVIIEKLIELILITFQDIKASANKIKEGSIPGEQFARGFIEDLKIVVLKIQEKVGKRADGSIGAVSDLTSNKLVSILIDLFTEEPTFEGMLQKMKTLRTQLEGKALSSLLQSVDFTQALIDLEQKYLFKVRQAIRKTTGPLQIEESDLTKEEETKMVEGIPTAQVEAKIKEQIKKRADEYREKLQKFNIKGFNFYDEMIRLDRTITKRNGSFIAAIIDRLLWGLNYFETKVRDDVKKWIKEKKEDLKKEVDKFTEKHKEKLAKAKKKIANVEGVIQSQILGLSARSFWTGATWQNSVGTTFQVISIGQFPRLKVVGLEKGGRAVIEEIAAGFQRQLDNTVGIVFPNPSYGIPPFQFKGYK